MLCQFSFKNFRSYKDETILDLQAVASSKDESKNFKESLLRGADGKEFLPVSVIYGPNAGGKSNAIRALHSVVAMIMRPVHLLKMGRSVINQIDCSPFLFNDSSSKEPTEFTLYFRPDEKHEYKYFISVLNGIIIEECLFRKGTSPRSRTVMLYKRNQDSITLGSLMKKEAINTEVNESLPYLSFLAINYKLEPIIKAAAWFDSCFVFNYADYFREKMVVVDMEDSEKHLLIHLLNDIGIPIYDYHIDEDDKSHCNITIDHIINGKVFQLDLYEESEGTKKLFSILPYVLYTLQEGWLLAVDELDAKLHPKLLKYIIMLFKNPEINTHGAQLIFTSHDISTMKSSVFRTDEIWFACKREDESSDLYSLYDIKDENGNHIQPSASFDKQYLEGRYGADPYFRNMMDWK